MGIKRIGLIVVLALLVGGGGGWAYLKFGKANPTGDGHREETPAAKKEAEVSKPVFMDAMIVNLADPHETRYLKLSVVVETGSSELEEEVKEKTYQLRDAIISVASQKTMEALRQDVGKIKLREEIQSRVNQVLTKGRIRGIYLTDIVVQ